MNLNKVTFLFFSLLILLISITSARYISFSTTISKEEVIKENESSLNIELLNSGDEAAFQVQVSLLLPDGFQANTLTPGILSPNEPYRGNFTLKIDKTKVKPGVYSVGVLTYYQDANGYPFSTVSPTSLIINEPTLSQIFGRISGEVTLSGEESKKLTLNVRNLDDFPHKVKIKLFLPRELKSNFQEKILQLNENEEEQVIFDISSFGALSGSTYVVFSSLEYEENNLHYSSIVGGIIKIVEPEKGGVLEKKSQEEEGKKWIKNLLKLSEGYLPIGILIILILIFIFYQFKK